MRKAITGAAIALFGLLSFVPAGAQDIAIEPGDAVASPAEKYELVHQGDGNVVLLNGVKPTWHTKTHGNDTSRLIMQDDGNLVLYDSNQTPVWHSGTHGYYGATLKIQDDGNVVIYDYKGNVAWAIKHWPPPPPPAPVEPYGVWDRLAQCEANGEWSYGPHSNWGSRKFHGGLQFHPNTWTAYKLAGYPQYAYQASRYQQIQVGKRVKAAQGWSAWPHCSKVLGLR